MREKAGEWLTKGKTSLEHGPREIEIEIEEKGGMAKRGDASGG